MADNVEAKVREIIINELGVEPEKVTPEASFVEDLVPALLQLIATEHYGIYHLTNAGYCTRHEFACAILELSGRAGVPVEPITLADYPRASQPPPFSPLVSSSTRGTSRMCSG